MAATTINWGDGTSDNITVTYTGTKGSSQIVIQSDPNLSERQRSRVLRFKGIDGIELGTATITQRPRSRSYAEGYGISYK